jgi:hypothetical protein
MTFKHKKLCMVAPANTPDQFAVKIRLQYTSKKKELEFHCGVWLTGISGI